MLPGPLGPHLSRGKLEANSRIGRYIFEIFMLKSIFDGKLIFYYFYFWKWIPQFVFVQKSSFRHFARNVTIVSPNGGPGGTNHSKCEKTQLSIFLPQSHIFAPKVHFGVIFSFLSYFLHFWLQMAQKSIKKPLLPQAFEPLGPKNAFWDPKCVKC